MSKDITNHNKLQRRKCYWNTVWKEHYHFQHKVQSFPVLRAKGYGMCLLHDWMPKLEFYSMILDELGKTESLTDFLETLLILKCLLVIHECHYNLYTSLSHLLELVSGWPQTAPRLSSWEEIWQESGKQQYQRSKTARLAHCCWKSLSKQHIAYKCA